VLLLGVLLALALVSAFAAIGPKQTSEQKPADENRYARLDAELPIVDYNAPQSTDAKARAKRAAKANRYSKGSRNISDETPTSAFISLA
jgi:hypothetical protein